MANVENQEADPKMHREVQNFLETVYTKQKVPDYEKNATTVQTLHQIMTTIKKDREINEAQIVYYNKLAESYELKAKELKENFESLGITLDDFPRETMSAARALAKAACLLDLEQPTATNFLFALNALACKKLMVSSEKLQWSRKLEKLKSKITANLEQIERVKKDVETTKQQHRTQSGEASKRKNQEKFLSGKIEEYKRKIRDLEAKLEESGSEPSIYHSTLMKKYENLQKMQQNLDEIKAKLESYLTLPPNEHLAQLKVEEARQELRNLENELQKKIEEKTKIPM